MIREALSQSKGKPKINKETSILLTTSGSLNRTLNLGKWKENKRNWISSRSHGYRRIQRRVIIPKMHILDNIQISCIILMTDQTGLSWWQSEQVKISPELGKTILNQTILRKTNQKHQRLLSSKGGKMFE